MRQETGVPRNKLICRLKSRGIGNGAQLLQPLPSMHEALGSTLGMEDVCCDIICLSPQHMGGGRRKITSLSLATW